LNAFEKNKNEFAPEPAFFYNKKPGIGRGFDQSKNLKSWKLC
jgi:hypothetical protein